ncbi:two-component system sensor histidine kinase SenX3 [Kineosporia succinea]|uniref:Sensor-like histidine kinase SenX3 n=1 Tax=Kineosporia succinea TaxID=84632 RepID=A0ABT9P2U0_9ACTN|nr:ATP-binding protein [Kineosporia succinea]MDP9827005.1 two-component system sensor histidine kinase SenX3 [Kineosporia succinea]
MSTPLAFAIATGIGLVVGLVLGVLSVAGRGRREEQQAVTPLPTGPLPEGAADVLNVLASASVVLGTDGRLIKSSPAAHAFGLVRGRELVHAELREMAAEAGTLGLVRERELELPRGPLGRGRLVVYARVAPLRPDLVLVLVEDRTEAKRVEEVRRDFVANVSHELKTPIGALSLLAEAVADAADDADAVRHFSGQMSRESTRLTKLVQEIIDLSRLQVADALHPPVPVGIDDAISDAVDRCSMASRNKNIEVVVGGDHGAVVYGDHNLLVTAIRNLVDNAISYSPENTRVGVGVRRVGGICEIVVSDQGIGISGADQDRIFERFYRVDPARSRVTGGTGLGLSIVKHVAANHGGEVMLWSRPGQGSTFTLRLPESVQPASHPVVDADHSTTETWEPQAPAPETAPLPPATPGAAGTAERGLPQDAGSALKGATP